MPDVVDDEEAGKIWLSGCASLGRYGVDIAKELQDARFQPVLSIPELRAGFQGSVIAPDDPRYDQARTVFAGGIDPRPAVIIRAAKWLAL